MKTSRTRKFADAVRPQVDRSVLPASVQTHWCSLGAAVAILATPGVSNAGAPEMLQPAPPAAPTASSSFNSSDDSSVSQSFGEIRWESQGFIKRSDSRPELVNMLALHPEFETEGDNFAAKLDLEAIAFWNDRSSLTVESAEAYVSTSPAWSRTFEFTLGRRIYNWSAIDEEWQLGLWSPRFTWDSIRPQTVGMTGAFAKVELGRWRILGVASPVSLPERGFPIRAKAGDLSSPSPDWVPPFEQVNLMNQTVGMRYFLSYPSLGSLLLVPTIAGSVRYGGDDEGFWMQFGGGLLPVHQVDLAIQAELVTPDLALEATLHPRRISHVMGTFETGYRSDSLSAWMSVSHENPSAQAIPDDWMKSPLGRSTILSGGLSTRVGSLSVTTSGIFINEEFPESGGSEVRLSTPPRYPYRRAIQMRGLWEGESRLGYAAKWIYDLENDSSVLMADMAVRLGSGVRVNLGADWFSSESRKGVLGQLSGNDRIRVGVAYAF